MSALLAQECNCGSSEEIKCDVVSLSLLFLFYRSFVEVKRSGINAWLCAFPKHCPYASNVLSCQKVSLLMYDVKILDGLISDPPSVRNTNLLIWRYRKEREVNEVSYVVEDNMMFHHFSSNCLIISQNIMMRYVSVQCINV